MYIYSGVYIRVPPKEKQATYTIFQCPHDSCRGKYRPTDGMFCGHCGSPKDEVTCVTSVQVGPQVLSDVSLYYCTSGSGTVYYPRYSKLYGTFVDVYFKFLGEYELSIPDPYVELPARNIGKLMKQFTQEYQESINQLTEIYGDAYIRYGLIIGDS